MYADPALIRKHVVKLTLNDDEAALLNSLVRITGEQKAVVLREMLMKKALEAFHTSNDVGALHAMPVPLAAPHLSY